MKVKVLVFAGLRELLGWDKVDVELSDEPTHSELIKELCVRYPQSAALLRVSRVAAGGQFVSLDSAVDPCVEIAIIPPVSGG